MLIFMRMAIKVVNDIPPKRQIVKVIFELVLKCNVNVNLSPAYSLVRELC